MSNWHEFVLQRGKPLSAHAAILANVVLSVLGVLLNPSIVLAQGGVVNSTDNPLQVALLHWNKTNQPPSFPVGGGPEGVAFDGSSIWVANSFTNSVTKLAANDGTVLGTFPVGGEPYGIAFDGANIWVSGLLGQNVTKLRASDGTNLGSFPTGTEASGVAFDGANVWVANEGSNTVTK